MENIKRFNAIQKIFQKNGGFVTRKNIDDKKIASRYLYDFVKRNNLVKLAPGIYADESYFSDTFYILQNRFPKYIFSGMSALYLHHLTDKIPSNIEVTGPQGYNPTRKKIDSIIIRQISNHELYNLGIIEIETQFSNKVKVYDEERTICDLIKYRNKYDSETFIKAIKLYVKKTNNQIKLFKYAKIMNIERKVYEIMEIINNED